MADWPSTRVAIAILYSHWANIVNDVFLKNNWVEPNMLGLGYCAVLSAFLAEMVPHVWTSARKLIGKGKEEKE